MNRTLCTTCLLLAITLSIACLPVDGKQPAARYPSQLHGVWQAAGNKCVFPGDLESTSRFEIEPDKLVGYEHWNEPTVVVQISKNPLAWKIKSRLYIGEYVGDTYEIYALSDPSLGMLTAISDSGSASYVRCI